MPDAIPFFKTHNSIGKSILTVSDVFRLAKDNGLESVVLIEDLMIGFPEALRLSKENGIKLIYGIRFDVCNSLDESDEEINSSRCKMIAIMKNDSGYKDLINLYTTVHTHRNKCIDYKALRSIWDDSSDIDLGLPFYDSFIARNCLTLSNCLPDFGLKSPFVCVESNHHPFDNIIQERVRQYCSINENRIVFCKSIYYEKHEDFDSYTVYRLICGRSVYGNSTLDRPNLPHFGSDKFCFDDWKENRKCSFHYHPQEKFSLQDKRIILFDTETEGLNLRGSRPWQIAWVEMKNGEVINKEMHYLAWDNLNVSKEAAAVTGFDKRVYDEKKEDPKEIIEKFWELIYEPDTIIAGQNILGFDIFILNIARREVGFLEDYSFLYKCIDTVPLSRAYLLDFRRSENESIIEFCYKLLNFRPKGRISVKLSSMLDRFGIKYKEDKLHDALIDTEMTGELFIRLIRALGLENETYTPLETPQIPLENDYSQKLAENNQAYDTPMLEGVILPKADILESEAVELGLPKNCSSFDFLKALCEQGLKKFGIDKFPNFEEYKKRLDYELEVLEACGFIDYMLLNREIIQFCNSTGIPIGDGRGSAAGCLVFYLIGVTGIDPLEHNLIFERFVSMARAQKKIGKDGCVYLDGGLLADCDLDISYSDRSKVVDFVFHRFDGNACKILTVSTLSGKLCIKETMKLVGGYHEEDTKIISDLIPKKYGVVRPLSEAYETSKDFKAFCDENEKVYSISLKLENLNKNTGVHPSGIAICAFPLRETMPLQTTKEGDLVSGFEMGEVAEIMTKFDLLGLRTLTQIKETCDMLGISHKEIDYKNPEIYKYINEYLMPKGLFQIESDTNYRVAQVVAPDNLDELSDVVALARPGALAYVNDYVKAKNTGEMRPSGDDYMDSLLGQTKGILLFQETLMNIAHKIFGFTLERADALRKCVTGDTRFLSKTRGWISINRLLKEGYKDDLFLVMDGGGVQQWKKIKEIWSNGIKTTRSVIDKNGRYVNASQYHRFLTNTGWKSRDRILEEDWLVTTHDVPFSGENTISKDLCIILAGLISEGYYYNDYCNFTNYEIKNIEVFSDACKREFGENSYSFSKDKKVVRIKKIGREVLHKIMKRAKSNSKDIPDIIFSQGKENLKAFISFLFEGDGEFSNDHIAYCSKSKKLVSSLQLLFSYFGIKTFILEKCNPKYGIFYNLHISFSEKRKYVSIFAENFSEYLSDTHRNKLFSYLENISDFSPCDDNIPRNIVDLLINEHPYALLPSGQGSGSFYKGDSVSRRRLKELLKHIKNDGKKWENFLNGKQTYTRVKSIELHSREIEVFDFTVDEETPFIVANGMVIHNCVGKKQVEKMPQFEQEILEGAKKNGVSEEAALYFWHVCQESANYSFNRCLGLNNTVELVSGEKIPLSKVKIGDSIKAFNVEEKKDHYVEVVNIYRSQNILADFKFYTYQDFLDDSFSFKDIADMFEVRSSFNHKYLDSDTFRMREAIKILNENLLHGASSNTILTESGRAELGEFSNIKLEDCIDLEVDSPDHNFYCNGVVVSNSHSISYAATAAKTVYLKYWFPKEFFCTLLEQANAEPDPFAEIEKISQELPYFGIKLLPPDLANSQLHFAIEGDNIRYGLASIKGVSAQTLQKVINFRNDTQKDICDIYNSAKRAGLSVGVLSSFAQAGLFDSFLNGHERCYMVYTLQVINVLTPRQRDAIFALYKNKKNQSPDEELDLLLIIADCVKNETRDSNGRILFRGGMQSLQEKCRKFKAIYEQNNKMPQFADWYYEKKVLGYAYSRNIKDIFKDENSSMTDCQEVKQLAEYTSVKIVGWISDDFQEGKSKKNGEKYWRFSVNDDKGRVMCLMMDSRNNRKPSLHLSNYIANGGKKPIEGNIVIVVGSKSRDIIFVNDLSIVEEKIYSRFSDLKDAEQ